MTQKDKELLLKDLCARLPYGVKVKCPHWDYERDDDFITVETLIGIDDKFCYTKDEKGNIDSHWYTAPLSPLKPYLRPMSGMTEEEKKELNSILEFQYYSDDSCMCESTDWLISHHFDFRGLIPMGLALPCKWLYRLEYKDDSCGLWYNGKGGWCFEEGIGSLDDSCKTKTLPMDYDERYKQGGRDWFSSCSRKEDLTHWYSKEDANKLISNGFVFTRYLATEFHEYDLETVFIKETCIKREVIDFNELFKDK